MRRRLCVYIGSFLVLCALSAGCADDEYSQRRIRLRQENFRETAASIEKREAKCSENLHEAGEAVERWWEADERETNENVEQAGDYIW